MTRILDNRNIFILLIAVIALLHIAVASYRPANRFDSEPAAGAFGGIRLFYLNPFNLDFSKGEAAAGGTSHILDNFIKSAVSGTHGMLDYLHWCVYILVYSLLGIPLSESWLLFGQALAMAGGLVIVSLLFAELYDSKPAALVFMVIASQFFITYSMGFYIIPPNILMEGLLLWAIYLYVRYGGKWKGSMLFLAIFANAASGNVIKLPVYLLYIWCVQYKVYGYGPVRSAREGMIKKPSNLVFLIPVLAVVAGHYYIFSRLGSSHLGMLGWIGQKMGASGVASKLSMLGQAFGNMLFQKGMDWWAVGLLVIFYVLAGLMAGRRTPLYFFPLAYFLYLRNTEPNGAVLPFAMILSLGIYSAVILASGVADPRRRKLCMVFSVILVSYTLITITSGTVYDLVHRKKPAPNYLKAAGYFLREHMYPDDKIASLLEQKENILNEYYYGKNFFKSPVFGKYIYDLRNITEPESPSNPVTPEERKTDFAFYVVSGMEYSKNKDYAEFVDSAVKINSLRKVADLSSAGVDYISIYSARPIRYENIDIGIASREFDRKYANIRKLFTNHHVGVASTWGFY